MVASFLVLFAAEWGDLSQLLTISWSASTTTRQRLRRRLGGAARGQRARRGRRPVLLRFISLHVLHYVGAGVCLLLAVVTAVELVRPDLPRGTTAAAMPA